eukprot:scaffold120744_cov48-Phaeocystis_antarctica.AAC.2
MQRLPAVCLLVACCGPSGTVADIWLEGPTLKQPGPKAASPASEGFASPPESDYAAFVRPPASHEASHMVGDEGDYGGVTSQSAAGAHAEGEAGAWRGVRGVLKKVSGLPVMVAKLVEKGAQEERAEAEAEREAQ